MPTKKPTEKELFKDSIIKADEVKEKKRMQEFNRKRKEEILKKTGWKP